ncbi:hypothetical protein A2U01_0050546, partial [Trifolium medium]|nr:hypothetical protein [Trifolium medium]
WNIGWAHSPRWLIGSLQARKDGFVDCDFVCVGKYGVEAQYEAVHLLYRSVHVGLLELRCISGVNGYN